MEEVKIDKNVPVPKKYNKHGFTATLRRCAIGDSFFLPEEQPYHSIHTIAKDAGIRIATRTEKNGRVRVWRME